VAIGKRLARVHEEERGDLESAEGAYQFVLDVAPLDPDALEALDRLHTASGEAEKLVVVLSRRAQIIADPEEKVGHTLRLAGDPARTTSAAWTRRWCSTARWSRGSTRATARASTRWRPSTGAGALGRALRGAGAQARRGGLGRGARGDVHPHGAHRGVLPGAPDDAVKLYEQVLVIRGEEAETLSAIAALHEAAGRWQDLIDVLERQLGSEADSDRRVEIALRVAAVYLEKLGDVERAIEGYRRVLDIEPASFDALRALAAIYRAGSAGTSWWSRCRR
jgi:tetratricopeptide (TPR) repeat protein